MIIPSPLTPSPLLNFPVNFSQASQSLYCLAYQVEQVLRIILAVELVFQQDLRHTSLRRVGSPVQESRLKSDLHLFYLGHVKPGRYMELILLTSLTLFMGYHVIVAWIFPHRLERFLRNFYNESSAKRVASSRPAFWIVRVFITVMFVICLGLLASGIVSQLRS